MVVVVGGDDWDDGNRRTNSHFKHSEPNNDAIKTLMSGVMTNDGGRSVGWMVGWVDGCRAKTTTIIAFLLIR